MQWAEHAALQELTEWLSRRDLGDPRQHIDAEAVFPNLAGLVRRRHLSETGDPPGFAGAQPGLRSATIQPL